MLSSKASAKDPDIKQDDKNEAERPSTRIAAPQTFHACLVCLSLSLFVSLVEGAGVDSRGAGVSEGVIGAGVGYGGAVSVPPSVGKARASVQERRRKKEAEERRGRDRRSGR